MSYSLVNCDILILDTELPVDRIIEILWDTGFRGFDALRFQCDSYIHEYDQDNLVHKSINFSKIFINDFNKRDLIYWLLEFIENNYGRGIEEVDTYSDSLIENIKDHYPLLVSLDKDIDLNFDDFYGTLFSTLRNAGFKGYLKELMEIFLKVFPPLHVFKEIDDSSIFLSDLENKVIVAVVDGVFPPISTLELEDALKVKGNIIKRSYSIIC